MSLLLTVFIWAIVLAVACWIVSLIPIPAGAPPFLRSVLYIAVALFALLMLFNLVGWLDLGWHPVVLERRR